MFFSRGKNKSQNPYTLPDMYKEYIIEYKDNDAYLLDYSTFVMLIEEYYKEMMNEILVHGAIFKLPYRLGFVRVFKRKLNYSNNLAIDWNTTNKVGKKVYHMNDHTGGYKYFFRWDKSGVIFKYKSLYRLVMTRSNKRLLAKLIKSGQDYYEINK